MPKPNADEILTSKHIRTYIQFGGPRPDNPSRYSGQDAQYMSVEGVGAPESGGVTPTFVPDPTVIGGYRLVGRKIAAPDLASATLKLLEKHGSIPRQLIGLKCPFNLYQPAGKCKSLSDFLAGWTDYVLIYSYAEVGNKDLSTRTGMEDDNVEDSLTAIRRALFSAAVGRARQRARVRPPPAPGRPPAIPAAAGPDRIPPRPRDPRASAPS